MEATREAGPGPGRICTVARFFLDTNVVAYADDLDSPAKLQQIMQGQQQKPKPPGKDW